MMTRRELNTTLGAAVAALLAGAVAPLSAQGQSTENDPHQGMTMPANRGFQPLVQQEIGDPGDCSVSMLILNLKPGSVSTPHKHPGPVFAYILEGEIENQVDPDPPKTYNVGDTFYEPALHVHRSLRNLSQSETARILVFQLIPKGQPSVLAAQ